jgi:hypothetical protein
MQIDAALNTTRVDLSKEQLPSTSNFKNRVDHADDEHTYVTLTDRLTWATRPDLAGPCKERDR